MAADEPIEAIWKPQEFGFFYQSFTTFYSCDSLEDKVEGLLEAWGATAQARVRAAGCGFGPTRAPYVAITMRSPVAATPEAIAERDKDKSTRELAARVRGKSTELADLNKPFAAQWKRVSLSRGALRIEPGDCELVEQMRREVLPKLAVRVVGENIRCMPHQISYRRPELEVDALVEAPKPDTPLASPP
jgi:hypothetical protein